LTVRYLERVRIFGAGTRRTRPGRAGGNETGDLDQVLAVAAASIGEVVAAAERAARQIREQTASELRTSPGAPRIDREQLVAELAESLAQRSEALAADAREVAGILERASVKLLPGRVQPDAQDTDLEPRDTAPNAPVGPEADPPQRTPTPPAFAPRPSAAAPAANRPDRPVDAALSPGIRLIAMQMAVAGSGREQIEDRLRRDFGVRDPSGVVSEVLAEAKERG
jgi:hypothetical protein